MAVFTLSLSGMLFANMQWRPVKCHSSLPAITASVHATFSPKVCRQPMRTKIWSAKISPHKIGPVSVQFGWYCYNTKLNLLLELVSWVASFTGKENIVGITTSLTPQFLGRSQNKANHHLIHCYLPIKSSYKLVR